jgi:hypothetical protein
MSAPTTHAPGSDTNGLPLVSLLEQIQAKHEHLEQTVRALREQVVALETECAVLQRERDGYRKQFHFLADKYLPEAPPEFAITKEEIEEAISSGRDFGQLIKELEAEWGLRQ